MSYWINLDKVPNEHRATIKPYACIRTASIFHSAYDEAYDQSYKAGLIDFNIDTLEEELWPAMAQPILEYAHLLGWTEKREGYLWKH